MGEMDRSRSKGLDGPAAHARQPASTRRGERHGATRVASPVLCTARSMLCLGPSNDPRRKRIGQAEQCLCAAQRGDISDARVKEHVHGPREQRARGAFGAACSILLSRRNLRGFQHAFTPARRHLRGVLRPRRERRPFRDWVFLTRCARVRRVPATLTAKARLSYPGRPCRSPVRPVCLRSASRSSLVASAVLADAKRDAEPARLLRALSQAGMVAVVSHRSAGLPSDSRDAARRNEKRGFRGRWLAP